MRWVALALCGAGLVAQAPRDLEALLRHDPVRCGAVLAAAREHRLQILLAEPVQRADGRLELVRSRFGDPRQYFYPASSIKLCGAVAALLELNGLNARLGTSHGFASALTIEPRFPGDVRIDADPTDVDGGRLTIGHALRKLCLVSDNAAYNHCVELLGQRGLNEAMWAGGFTSVRLWHRLSESRTAAENAVTRPISLQLGAVTTALPGRDAGLALDNGAFTDLAVGTGYLQGGKLVEQPMSFAEKNAITLADLQNLLVEVVRPEIDTGTRGFPGLTLGQRSFLVQALGEFPRESRNPRYDAAKVPDHHCKFVLRGVQAAAPTAAVRIYDKIGRAYGFSIENAYVEDARTGRGFFLAIVLYTNPDGVLNDDRYAYEELADPFLDAVGELVTRAVWGG